MDALAVVQSGSIRVASEPFARLTGYSVGELTGPEFRFEHLFEPGAAPDLTHGLTRPRETWMRLVSLAPLRGPLLPCMLAAQRLGSTEPAIVALLLRPVDGVHFATTPPGMLEVELEEAIGRSLARGAVTHLAREQERLRVVAGRIESLETSHPEILASRLAELASLHVDLARLEDVSRRIETRKV